MELSRFQFHFSANVTYVALERGSDGPRLGTIVMNMEAKGLFRTIDAPTSSKFYTKKPFYL